MAKQPARKGPVNRPQAVRKNTVLTPSERGDFETKSLKQARTNPKATSPMTATGSGGKPPSGKPPVATASSSGGGPLAKRGGSSVVPKMGATPRVEKTVSGSHEMVRPKSLPGAGKAGGMSGMLKGIPVIGAIISAAVGGYNLRDTPLALKARGAVVEGAAKLTGLSKKEQGGVQAVMPVSGRKTVTAPGGSTPVVPSKTVSSAPPQGSSPPPMKKAPAPSQKATGASKSPGRAMKGAELANFLGLSADSAVRTYMETGKHKYPAKK